MRVGWWFFLALIGSCSHYEPLPSDQITKLTPDGKELAPQPKKRLLVLPTLNKTPHGGNFLAEHATRVISDFVVSSPDLLLVKATDLMPDTFVSPNGLEYDWKSVYDRARSAGILGVVGSSLDEIWFHGSGDEVGLFRSRHVTTGLRVHVELHDVRSELMLFTSSHVGELTEERLRLYSETREPASFDEESAKSASQKALEAPLKGMSPHLVRLGWSGRVAKVDIHRYYLNAGEMSGLTRGQLLKVFSEGGPIFDPDTNVLVGRAPGTFKGILRVIDFFGRDGAVAVLHSGGNIREKDRIEVYSSPPSP